MMNRRTAFTAIFTGAAIFAGTPAWSSTQDRGNLTDSSENPVWSGRSSASALVKNPFVRPVWIGATDSFWYRRDTEKGHDFRIVDAATGRSRPAFDHRALSVALSRMSVAMAAEHLELHKLRFSDDGSLISFENDGQSYECRIASARCSRHPSAGTELELSPDGRRGIFARDANLWVRDLTTGREQQLTSDGQADNGYGIYPDGWKADFIPRAKSQVPLAPWHVQWSPDSTKVLVPHLDQRHVKTYPFIEYAPDDSFRPNVYNVHLPLVGEKPADLTWFVLDTIKGTKVRIEFPYEKFLPLQQDLVSLRRAIWSDDGKRLYSVVFGDELKESFLFETDLGTGKTRTVIQERGEPHANLNSTSYNPPNVQLANDAVDVVWYSERDGWGHLYLYDGRTGALKRQLTKGDWLVRDIIKVDGARRLIYFSGAGREGGDPYYRYIYRVNFDGSDLKLLTPQALDHLITGEENDVLSLDGATGYQVVAPSGRFFVYNASALDKVPEASIRRTTDGGLVATFQKADASKLFAAGYQPPVSVMLRAASGNEPIYGALYKPANLDPKKRYPIIDTQYVSPLTAVVPHNFMAALDSAGPLEPSSLVQHGFAAVVMDARGTTYRSRAFSEGMFGRLDTMNLEDHVVGIKQLAQTYSWIDADRVGISGASYGGWTALRGLLTQPDFFKVGVASVPAGTFHTLYLDYHWTAFQGKPVYKGGSLLRPTPLDIPKNWEKLNSDAEVGELKGKLLMIIGGLDENVPAGSPMRFFRKAAAAGKDVSLIYMPSASHSSAIDPYSWQKTLRFLQEGLGGAE